MKNLKFRSSVNRPGEHELYRAKRTSHNDDHGDRKDDGYMNI